MNLGRVAASVDPLATGGFLDYLGRSRVVAVVPRVDVLSAVPLARALSRGGIGTVEVTLRTDTALDALHEIAARGPADVVVGAGTVLTADQADAAVDAGAAFVVSPGFSRTVVRRCQRLGVPCIPGIATATDVMAALDAGLTTVKFFPALAAGGPPVLQALAAVFPQVRWVPTGGITSETLGAWLMVSGVIAVGGSWMADPADLAASEAAARTAVALVAATGRP